MKFLFRVLLFILIPGLFLCFFQTQLYQFRSQSKLPESAGQKLLDGAATALKSQDVPVGAMMLYDDSVLSVAYNTVYRDSNAGGHAEINAMSEAIRKTGFENFSKLDRDKLVLVSTFEPCPMCRGAILEYNIRRVYFLKSKSLWYWLKNDLKQFRYELNKSQKEGEGLQDSLFRLHPKYGTN